MVEWGIYFRRMSTLLDSLIDVKLNFCIFNQCSYKMDWRCIVACRHINFKTQRDPLTFTKYGILLVRKVSALYNVGKATQITDTDTDVGKALRQLSLLYLCKYFHTRYETTEARFSITCPDTIEVVRI